jgi:peroxin-12
MATLKSSFKAVYPYSNVAYELYLLSYNVRYLFDKTPYWRPWLSWMNVEVRRMSAADYVRLPLPFLRSHSDAIGPQRAAQTATTSLLSSPLRRHSSTGLPPSYSTVVARSISLIPLLSFEGLKFLLPTSIFFFRFLEWWYGSDGGYGRLRKKGGAEGKALRAPPPRVEGGKEVKKGKCIVHGGDMVNPTALPTGWLGCYKCLFTWVEEKESCPVTGAKVALSDLRKIVG